MQGHDREEVARYRGEVYAWDVVNEAIDSDGSRKTILLEKLGEDYVADAFRVAHEADPNALLFYNDYSAEAAGGLQKAKSDRVHELVKKLVADGVAIHGVGLQMHLRRAQRSVQSEGSRVNSAYLYVMYIARIHFVDGVKHG